MTDYRKPLDVGDRFRKQRVFHGFHSSLGQGIPTGCLQESYRQLQPYAFSVSGVVVLGMRESGLGQGQWSQAGGGRADGCVFSRDRYGCARVSATSLLTVGG